MAKERLYYIDWLRVLVVLSLIPYHSALTYTGLGDIYIRTPMHDVGVVPFLLITVPLRSFFMTLLFFVSGIAAYYSFQYRGRKQFIKERIRKIFVPLILGTLILCPIQAYFKALYHGFSGSLIKFIPEFFSYKIINYLGYSHLWFLLYLFVFSLLCLPIFSKWSDNHSDLMRISNFLCKRNNIYLPILFIIAAEMLLRPFYPGPQTLIGDWANDIVYFSMFVFGFVFASDVKIQDRVYRLANASKIIFFVLIVVYIMIEYILATRDTDCYNLEIILAVSKGLYECAAIIFLLWQAKKFLNRKSSVLSYLNGASFTVYMVHFVPVSMFTYLFAVVDMNVYLKYFLVVFLAYSSVLVIYEVFVHRRWLSNTCDRQIYFRD